MNWVIIHLLFKSNEASKSNGVLFSTKYSKTEVILRFRLQESGLLYGPLYGPPWKQNCGFTIRTNRVNENDFILFLVLLLDDGIWIFLCYTELDTLRGIEWTNGIDQFFAENEKASREDDSVEDILWQYFGSQEGFIRNFPANQWPSRTEVRSLFSVQLFS